MLFSISYGFLHSNNVEMGLITAISFKRLSQISRSDKMFGIPVSFSEASRFEIRV
jgi:hypothetical protein